jgi:hypothetical protein
MSQWAVPLAVTGSSLALTYLFCLRPMRQGHCATTPSQRHSAAFADTESTDEITKLRVEVAKLRAERQNTRGSSN